MITIQTDKKHRVNKIIIIAGRNVEFDEFGMAEVPERYVESIINSDPSIILVDDEDAKEFKKLKESNKKQSVADIDVADENKKLKAEIKKLEKEIASLEKTNEKLVEEKTALLEKIDGMQPAKDEDTPEDGADLGLNKMKKAELEKLCIKLELPEDEWKGLTNPKLIEYIEEKMKDSEE